MMRWGVLSLILTLAAPAQAWIVKSDSVATARGLRAEANTLPPCVRTVVERRLRVVLAVPHALKFPTDAHSFFAQGVMLLTTDRPPELLKTAFAHELGHFYDWELRISGTPRFRAALAADFAAMNDKERYEERYLRDPQEAYAELFAAHFRGASYWLDDHYDVWAYPATNVIVVESLTRCGE